MENKISLSVFGITVDAHDLFGSIPDLVCVLDSDMSIVYSNWQGIAKYIPEPSKKLNIKCFEAIKERESICPGCDIEQAIIAKKPVKSIQRLNVSEDVSPRLVEVCAVPIMDDNNVVKYFIKWSKDITEMTKSKLEVATQRSLLRSTLDNVMDVISVKDPKQNVEFYNLAGYEVLNSLPHKSNAKKCFEFLGRDRPCDVCPTDTAIKEKRTVEVNKYIPEIGRHFNCRVLPVLDESGNVVRTVEHLRDITEQRELEIKLMRQHEQLESLVSNIPGIIFSCKFDESWTMTYMSDKDVEHITGYHYADFINNKVRSYKSIIHPDDVGFVEKIVHECVQENKPWEIEYRIITKDESVKWVFEKGRATIDNAGYVESLNGIIQDITGRVQTATECG